MSRVVVDATFSTSLGRGTTRIRSEVRRRCAEILLSATTKPGNVSLYATVKARASFTASHNWRGVVVERSRVKRS